MVQVFTTKERIYPDNINRRAGNRIRYRWVDAETGEEVPWQGRIEVIRTDGILICRRVRTPAQVANTPASIMTG
jgi:hypothetical protein